MTIPIDFGMPEFVAIDVETTLNGNEDVGLAHPMHPDNKVVLFGAAASKHIGSLTTYTAIEFELYVDSLQIDTIICGHNISFDLMYLYKEDFEFKQSLQKHRLWDTQLAEYILTGQRTKFSSLDELSIKYGLPVKDDTIKRYFQAGLGSDKIPSEELVPYLIQDTQNTLAIAKKQYELAVAQGQLTLIQSQMEALHATTEMMYNGLCIDQAALDR